MDLDNNNSHSEYEENPEVGSVDDPELMELDEEDGDVTHDSDNDNDDKEAEDEGVENENEDPYDIQLRNTRNIREFLDGHARNTPLNKLPFTHNPPAPVGDFLNTPRLPNNDWHYRWTGSNRMVFVNRAIPGAEKKHHVQVPSSWPALKYSRTDLAQVMDTGCQFLNRLGKVPKRGAPHELDGKIEFKQPRYTKFVSKLDQPCPWDDIVTWKRLVRIFKQMERRFRRKFIWVQDGDEWGPWFRLSSTIPEGFSRRFLYFFMVERRNRKKTQCNKRWEKKDVVLEDEETMVLELYFQSLTPDEQYREFLSLPIVLHMHHPCTLSIGKKHHGECMHTDWPLGPTDLNQRVAEKNNMLFETKLSNFAKYRYIDSEVKRILPILLGINLPIQVHNPDAPLPDATSLDIREGANDVIDDPAQIEQLFESNTRSMVIDVDDPTAAETTPIYMVTPRSRRVALREWLTIYITEAPKRLVWTFEHIVRQLGVGGMEFTVEEVVEIVQELANTSFGVWVFRNQGLEAGGFSSRQKGKG